ncbi:MAG: hypothetical protein AAGA87_16565 [Pseudomonadota bacterium]
MIPIVLLFLVGMVVLAVMGRMKRSRQAAKCPACGRHRIGKGPCACGKR